MCPEEHRMISRTRGLVLFLALLLSASASYAQNKERVNRVITNARWVAVVSDRGADEFSPRLPPEDREAIEALRGAIQDWGFFKLAYNVSDAELIFVIHSEGREGLLGRANRTLERGDLCGDEDTLFIYDARQYPHGSALWRAALRHGLQQPRMALFEEFKRQVEEAAAAAPASKKTKKKNIKD